MPSKRITREGKVVLVEVLGDSRKDGEEGLRRLGSLLLFVGIATAPVVVVRAANCLQEWLINHTAQPEPEHDAPAILRSFSYDALGPDDWQFPGIKPYDPGNQLTEEAAQRVADWEVVSVLLGESKHPAACQSLTDAKAAGRGAR